MRNVWMFLQQTAWVSLAALFVLVLQWLFRDRLSPKWRYTVWLVLLCRLVIPVGWSRGTMLDVSGWLDTLRVWVEMRLSSAWSSPWEAGLPVAPIPQLPSWGWPSSITDWLFVAYLIGALACALWLLAGWMGLRRLEQDACPVADSRWEQVKELAEKLDLKAPARMVESPSTHSPFVMGVVSTVLVVPMGWQVDEKVILHELIHLENRDVAAGWVGAAFRCIHWCNPFLWWVIDRVEDQREQRCDQQVLERLEGEERRDYGRVLLSMAEDRVIRVPGATSMANGAERIRQRIMAIAKFKTYPQGVGLVSVCMALLLIPYLAVGFSAVAAGEEDVPHDFVSQALSYAQCNPCTTVAGALDAYAKGMYYEIQSPNTTLVSKAMVTRGEDMALLVEEWEQKWAEWEKTPILRHHQLENAYRTGPLFRGLTQTGEDSWVCQVYFFRDKLENAVHTAVQYLCHTVEITRHEDGQHTVQLLDRCEGELPLDASVHWCEDWGEVPCVWRGTVAGIEVIVRPQQQLLVQGGYVNSTARDLKDQLEPDWKKTEIPDPDALFSSCYGMTVVTLVNHTEEEVTLNVRVKSNWSDGVVRHSSNFVSLDARLKETLAPGEEYARDCGGGGASYYNGLETESCVTPDGYTATIEIGEETYTVQLVREVNW